MNFLAADIPDPTDFPPHTIAPGLRTLDGSFRCDICGELYDAPVTIACGHCFCSACIRNALSIKQECPSCRKTTGEGHIRPNPILEGVISAWKDARPFVLRLLKCEEECATNSLQLNKETARKRKRTGTASSTEDVLENVAGPSHKLLSPKSAVVPKTPSRPKKLKTRSEEPIDITIPSSDADEDEITILSSHFAPKADVQVSCPLCQKKVLYRTLNAHMDTNCKDDSAAMTWSKIMGGGKNGQHKGKHKKKGSDSDDEHPLPLSTYTTLKDKQLKDMLVDHELSLTGDRLIWEQRHKRWVIIFNANMDKSIPNRKTKAELRRDLKKWEEDMSRKKKIVIADVKEYQIEQKSEFARLIEAARPARKTVPPEEKNALQSSPPSNMIPAPQSS